MRIRYIPLIVCTLALAAPAGAQDQDVSATVREALRSAREAVRTATREVAREVARESRESGRAPRPHAYQGRGGPEQTERFSRTVTLGPNGSVSVSNIAGDIVVNAGNGDTVSIEAVKQTRGDREELGRVEISVDHLPGRVDISTNHIGRHDRVSVNYTITVPASASVEVHSVSGNVKVTGVQGAVRGETVSGNVVMASTPRLEAAKSVSGDVELTGAAADGDLSASSVSGEVRANGLKARGLQVGSVSGNIVAKDVTCDRLSAKSVSGDIEFSGALMRAGRYEVTTHSGDVRLTLAGGTGFELSAASFSGSIRSDFPLTVAGGQALRRHGPGQAMHATFGDGSAALNLNTFSGDIVVAKR
ncbi:MAG: DUF4097 family beta strand repeat-containing protein [Betaproteobacteria bacterium]